MFNRPTFGGHITYRAAIGTIEIKRVEANRPTKQANETMCPESLISLFLSHKTIVAERIRFVIKSLRTTDSYQYAGDATNNIHIYSADFAP